MFIQKGAFHIRINILLPHIGAPITFELAAPKIWHLLPLTIFLSILYSQKIAKTINNKLFT